MHKFNLLFKDLQVIEIATALAGPLTGTFLKELGANVIKVEPPTGDVSRNWKNPFEKDQASSIYFDSVNGNKRTISLNLKNDDELRTVKEMIKKSDIVITNFTYRKAEEYGFLFHQLQAIKSDIILANITGYGPASNRSAFDMMIQADSGLLSMTGEPEGKPVKVPIAIADVLASHQLREGILCALLLRWQTGAGSEIQVSLIDSLLAAFVNQAGNYLMGNYIPKPMGTLHPSIAPYGELFQTKDGKWLLLAIGSEHQFQDFCSVISCYQWKEDPRFKLNQYRLKNRKDLSEQIAPIIAGDTAEHWLVTFEKYRIPAAIIRNLQEVLEDPTLRHLIKEEEKNGHEIHRIKTVVF